MPPVPDWCPLQLCCAGRQLQVLHIHHSRINSKHIACLASLHHSLIDISFKGCRGIDNRSLSTIAQLTALQALCLEGMSLDPLAARVARASFLHLSNACAVQNNLQMCRNVSKPLHVSCMLLQHPLTAYRCQQGTESAVLLQTPV